MDRCLTPAIFSLFSLEFQQNVVFHNDAIQTIRLWNQRGKSTRIEFSIGIVKVIPNPNLDALLT